MKLLVSGNAVDAARPWPVELGPSGKITKSALCFVMLIFVFLCSTTAAATVRSTVRRLRELVES